MAGGIFQFFWSSCVIGRGGECMTGTGGEPGPRGTFVCLNLGGSSGSTGMSCILTMRWPAPEACAAFWLEGVYLSSSSSSSSSSYIRTAVHMPTHLGRCTEAPTSLNAHLMPQSLDAPFNEHIQHVLAPRCLVPSQPVDARHGVCLLNVHTQT
eukprot:1158352-Pelagomonas_calceolata.AAC.3